MFVLSSLRYQESVVTLTNILQSFPHIMAERYSIDIL